MKEARAARRSEAKGGRRGGSLPHLVGGISCTIVQNTKGAIAFLYYHNSFKSGNLTLSVDNIVIDLYLSRPPDRERLMHLLETLPFTRAVEVTHWSSFKMGSFKEQFSIRFQNGNSFWIGAVLNGCKPEYGRVRIDFNPNKVAEHEVFQLLLEYLVDNTRPMHRKIRRYDLAADIPVLRQDVFLVKDNRAYIERRHGQEWTQYLGAKSSTVGRVKLYNKQTEAHLNYPLTRLELTLDPATPYDKINFPTVFYLDDMQMCIEEAKATETERFIIEALLQGCGTIDQLGRRTQAKIKALIESYTKRVEISEQDYSRILSQVNGYKSGVIQTRATETDQSPRREAETPDWLQMVKQAQAVQESEIIKSAAKRPPLALLR